MLNSEMGPAFQPFASSDEMVRGLVPREEFIAALGDALAQHRGFAAAKIGFSEEKLMLLLQLRETNAPTVTRRVLEKRMEFEELENAGIFPSTAQALAEFAQVYREAVRQLDYLGLLSGKLAASELETINYHKLTNRLIRFQDLHPDRSIPDNPERCYLPLLRGKRVLIVNPFGKLLAQRATREIFEGVWRTTGKKFFEPASVEGLEFPYGFARETWLRYASVLDLMREIQERMEQHEFDVALVGAGGMGVPLTVHAKQMGKVGIMLGGHLQVLFGVKGARWKKDRGWRETFFNEWWIDMPEQYLPKPGEAAGEHAYW